MELAQVAISGHRQVLTLPESVRFSESSVYVRKVGNAVLLVPQGKNTDIRQIKNYAGKLELDIDVEALRAR